MSSFVLPFTMQPHATGFSSDLPSKKVFLRRLAGSHFLCYATYSLFPFRFSNRICPKHGLEASYVSLELVNLTCGLKHGQTGELSPPSPALAGVCPPLVTAPKLLRNADRYPIRLP